MSRSMPGFLFCRSALMAAGSNGNVTVLAACGASASTCWVDVAPWWASLTVASNVHAVLAWQPILITMLSELTVGSAAGWAGDVLTFSVGSACEHVFAGVVLRDGCFAATFRPNSTTTWMPRP